MLNGDAPVDGSYFEHVLEKLNEDDSDDDFDGSVSNAHENVRKDT